MPSPSTWYAEAAHTRALGAPHDGPDSIENVLFLCPNDHVRFDTGAILINSAYQVLDTANGPVLGCSKAPVRTQARLGLHHPPPRTLRRARRNRDLMPLKRSSPPH